MRLCACDFHKAPCATFAYPGSKVSSHVFALQVDQECSVCQAAAHGCLDGVSRVVFFRPRKVWVYLQMDVRLYNKLQDKQGKVNGDRTNLGYSAVVEGCDKLDPELVRHLTSLMSRHGHGGTTGKQTDAVHARLLSELLGARDVDRGTLPRADKTMARCYRVYRGTTDPLVPAALMDSALMASSSGESIMPQEILFHTFPDGSSEREWAKQSHVRKFRNGVYHWWTGSSQVAALRVGPAIMEPTVYRGADYWTLEQSMANRLAKDDVPRWEPTRKLLSRLTRSTGKFMDKIRPAFTNLLDDMQPLLRLFASRKWTDAQYDRAYDQLSTRGVDTLVKIFVKTECQFLPPKTLEIKGHRPRFICNVESGNQLAECVVIHLFEHAIVKTFPKSVIKGALKTLKMQEIMESFSETHGSFMEGDGSAWDKCCRKIREFVDIPILEELNRTCPLVVDELEGAREAALDMRRRRQVKLRLNLKAEKCDRGAEFEVENMRLSGDRGTSILNWAVNAIAWGAILGPDTFFDYEVGGKKAHWAFEGDDSLIKVDAAYLRENRKRIEKEWKSLGFNMKLVVRGAKEGPGALQFVGYDISTAIDGDNIVAVKFAPQFVRNIVSSSYSISAARVTSDHVPQLAYMGYLARALAYSEAGCTLGIQYLQLALHWKEKCPRPGMSKRSRKVDDEVRRLEYEYAMKNGEDIQLHETNLISRIRANMARYEWAKDEFQEWARQAAEREEYSYITGTDVTSLPCDVLTLTVAESEHFWGLGRYTVSSGELDGHVTDAVNKTTNVANQHTACPLVGKSAGGGTVNPSNPTRHITSSDALPYSSGPDRPTARASTQSQGEAVDEGCEPGASCAAEVKANACNPGTDVTGDALADLRNPSHVESESKKIYKNKRERTPKPAPRNETKILSGSVSRHRREGGVDGKSETAPLDLGLMATEPPAADGVTNPQCDSEPDRRNQTELQVDPGTDNHPCCASEPGARRQGRKRGRRGKGNGSRRSSRPASPRVTSATTDAGAAGQRSPMRSMMRAAATVCESALGTTATSAPGASSTSAPALERSGTHMSSTSTETSLSVACPNAPDPSSRSPFLRSIALAAPPGLAPPTALFSGTRPLESSRDLPGE